jgi:4-diphosphocytidyl-2-C-methyl-D-erythritol kinase
VNLALVVGPLRADGKHEVATALQRVELHDDVDLEPAPVSAVEGFDADTLVTGALAALAAEAGASGAWRVRIVKRIPVAAGLGGGSSDAAAALLLANERLPEPLPPGRLHALAARIGADVPFFLYEGAQLATGDGTILRSLSLPLDYVVLLVRPRGVVKDSTRAVYARFDQRRGARGFAERRSMLDDALARVDGARDLAGLPRNDLVSSPLTDRLAELGAFRADVSGAGPTVYGLFEERREAEHARAALEDVGETWLTHPV